MKTTMKASNSSPSEVNGAALAQQSVKLPGGTERHSAPAGDIQDCTSVAEWLRTRAADLKSTPQVWLVFRPGPDSQALLGTVEADGHEQAQAVARSQWPMWAPDLHAFFAPAVAQIHEKYRRRIARDPFPPAFREAGHAVIGRHNGAAIIAVDILPRMFSTNCQFAPYHDSFGKTTFYKPRFGHTKRERRLEAEEIMVSRLAGSAAETRFRPSRRRRNSGERDMASIIHLLLEHGPVDVEPYFEKMKALARKQVGEHWTDIQTVATALADRHELTGDDIDDLLKDRPAVTPA